MNATPIVIKSIDEIIEEMKADRLKAKQSAKKARHDVAQQILKAGLTYIYVDFNGSGDSGSIDDIRTTENWEQDASLPDGPLKQLISDWSHLFLEGTNVDWYNNDGGQGHIIFDLTTVPWKFEASIDINITSSENAYSAEEVL